MKTILILMLSWNTVTVNAQQEITSPSSDTIRWEYSAVKNLNNDELIAITGHFISYGDQGFLWIQDGVEQQYSFTINSVEGVWLNVAEHGSITYQATCNDVTGTISVSRESGAVKITLNMGEPGALTPHLSAVINSYSKL